MNSILIVDDEIEVCLLLSNYLKKNYEEVAYAITISDALDKFKKLKPNILILDHNMPDGHGIDYIPVFKDSNDAVTVIIISAMSHLRTEALEQGADFFLEKPISFSTLAAILPKN
jgi:DNA-binding response OmpR family regulator